MSTNQSFEQAEERAEDILDLNQPNIAVFAEPSDNPSNPLISTADINEFAEKELKKLEGLDLSTIAGGIYAITPPRIKQTAYRIEQTEYWELKECGLVYYRRIWFKKEERNYEYAFNAREPISRIFLVCFMFQCIASD